MFLLRWRNTKKSKQQYSRAAGAGQAPPAASSGQPAVAARWRRDDDKQLTKVLRRNP